MNLVYYWATKNKDQKQLDEFNSTLAKANSRWQMEIIRGNRTAQRVVNSAPQDRNNRKGKLPPPPSWWKDGKDSAQQSMIAARELSSLNVKGKR